MVRIPTATIAAGLVLLFVLLNPRGATADDWYVFPPGVPANAGEPDIPASQVFPTIQAAVDAPSVEDRDRVILADPTQEGSDGTFFGDGNQNVALTKALRIRSESGAPEECNVFAQGPPPRRHFFISGHEADGASFQGINFSGGNAVGFGDLEGGSNGGSIYCEDVSDLFVTEGRSTSCAQATLRSSTASSISTELERRYTTAAAVPSIWKTRLRAQPLLVQGSGFLGSTRTGHRMEAPSASAALPRRKSKIVTSSTTGPLRLRNLGVGERSTSAQVTARSLSSTAAGFVRTRPTCTVARSRLSR